MGRFYKTSEAAPIDYMYKLNTPLMEKVINVNDEGITQNLDKADDLTKALTFNHLTNDDEDVNNLVSGYSKQIDDLTSNIRGDYANWRKNVEPIRQLKTKLYNDYTTGAISKYVENYGRRKTVFDNIDKQVQNYNEGKPGIDPYSASVFKDKWDTDFNKTGYDSKTGNYNVYRGGAAVNNVDINKVLSEGLDKIKADKTKDVHEEADTDPWYIDKITHNRVTLTPEKILQTAYGNINSDLMTYLRQRQGVGLIKNAVDDNGNLIKPYSVDAPELSDEEKGNIDKLKDLIFKAKDPQIKQQLADNLQGYTDKLNSRREVNYNDDSYLSPYLRKLANQFSQNDTDDEFTTKDNKKMSTMFVQGQQNMREGAKLKQQGDIAANNLAEKAKEFGSSLKYKYDYLEYLKNKPTGKGSTKAPTKPNQPLPKETGVSELGTRSFEDWKTNDKNNQSVPVISNEGLSADIDRFKNNISNYNTRLDEINTDLLSNNVSPVKKAALKIEKQGLQTKLIQDESDLGVRRNLYENITNEAIDDAPRYGGTTINTNQKDLYNEFKDDRDGTKKLNYINNELRKKYPDIVDIGKTAGTAPGLGTLQAKVYKNSPQVQAELDKLNQYKDVKKIVDENRNKVSAHIRTDVINSDAIELGDKDSKDVSDIVLNSTNGSEVYDDLGNKTDGTSLDEKGWGGLNNNDNDNFSIADGQLQKYMSKNGVTMQVIKVGTTTKLGNGNAVAQVKFNDPTGGIDNDRTYYISLGDKASYDIGTKFKNHANPNVANIANAINDPESNNIRKQIMQPSAGVSPSGRSGYSESTYNIIVGGRDSKGDNVKLPLKIHRINDGGADHLSITLPDSSPFPRTDGKPDGIFNGAEDFISQYKQQK